MILSILTCLNVHLFLHFAPPHLALLQNKRLTPPYHRLVLRLPIPWRNHIIHTFHSTSTDTQLSQTTSHMNIYLIMHSYYSTTVCQVSAPSRSRSKVGYFSAHLKKDYSITPFLHSRVSNCNACTQVLKAGCHLPDYAYGCNRKDTDSNCPHWFPMAESAYTLASFPTALINFKESKAPPHLGSLIPST